MQATRERRFWSIPACAWKRPLGDLPASAAQIYGGVFNTVTRPKKGLPLGGIGAGNFMYNVCGTFGPWHMKAGRYEERFLPQAAFHVREQVGAKPAKTRTLATDDVLPAWDRLSTGEGAYYALFPRGWCTYTAFDTDVSLLFFSPIVKDNYRETSYPAAVFLFRVANPGPDPAQVSIMFTFPNAPYTGPSNLNLEPQAGDDQTTAGMRQMFAQFGALHARERKGLRNEAVAAGGTAAVVMTADDAGNPVETQGTQWCVAASGDATYVTVWDGAGDGRDIWDDFAGDGRLSNGAHAPASSEPAGAVALQVTLKPGEDAVLPFALTWDFPFIESGVGTRWLRRYTEYFETKPGNALAVAEEALRNREAWLDAVEGWTRPIADSPAYPDWLKQGALNELYYITFGGSFWENGCVTKPKQFGARPGQHLASVMECQEYPFAETFDVRHHAARTTRDLWPQIERDILLADADFIMDTSQGSAPHDAGSPHDDPFFNYDYYIKLIVSFMPDAEPEKAETTPWSEFSPKFIQQSFAYWHKTGDDAFLDEIWEAAVRTFHYQVATDTDGDGITEMKSSEYADNKFFNAVLWIGALEMLCVMADKKKDRQTLAEAQAQLAQARDTAERLFWNADLGYYQFNTNSTDLMGDAFIGQRYVDTTGLPPTLNPERMTSHYRQAFRLAAKLLDTDGDGIGDVGIGNVLSRDGGAGSAANIARHHLEVWVGVSYVFAANLYHWGRRINDGALQAAALMLGWGVHRQTWRNDKTAYWFGAPEAWDLEDPTRARAPMYQRARGIWELLMEVHDPY